MFIKLRVTPDARQNRVVQKDADTFFISVREKAERGEATRAALGLLATHLELPVRRLRVVKGSRFPSKIIEIVEKSEGKG